MLSPHTKERKIEFARKWARENATDMFSKMSRSRHELTYLQLVKCNHYTKCRDGSSHTENIVEIDDCHTSAQRVSACGMPPRFDIMSYVTLGLQLVVRLRLDSGN